MRRLFAEATGIDRQAEDLFSICCLIVLLLAITDDRVHAMG